MKLANFRGIQEREIQLGDGVTIVEGPNETGKSSFQDALDLLFRRKDSAGAIEVLDAIPNGKDVGPEVEAEIEAGSYAFVFRKRFRKRPETVLEITRPTSEKFVGDQAHERANAILEETLDRDLWERLRVRQADRLAPAVVGNAPALMTALDSLSGGGGQLLSDSGVIPKVEAAYKRYFTLNRGAETGELQKARAEEKAAKEDYQGAQAQLSELEGQIETYQRLLSEVAKLEARVGETKADAAKRVAALRVFESVKERVAKAQTAFAQAETAETKARGAKEARGTLKANANSAAAAFDKANGDFEGAKAAFAKLKTAYDEAEEALRGAKKLEQEASDHLSMALKRVEYLDASEQRGKLAERVVRIEGLVRQIDEANATTAANPIDDELIGKVREADRARREAQAALRAGAPEIAIDVLGSLSARVNEEALTLAAGEHRDYQAAEEFRLELPEVLKFLVRPGASLADLQSARHEAESELERLLLECGTDSVEGAERLARERIRSAETAKTADTEAKALRGGEDLSDLRALLAALLSRIDGLVQVLEEPDALDKGAAFAARERAQATYDQLSAQREGAQATFNGLSEPYGGEKQRLEQANKSLETAHANLGNAFAELAEAREKVSDEALDSEFVDAETNLKASRNALTKEQQLLDSYDEESIRTLADNSQRLAEDVEKKLNETRQRFAGVRALVEVNREKGLFESAQEAKDRAAASSETLARVEARALGAKRLLEVLLRSRQEAYEKHRAPFRERVEKLSRLAFGKDVQVELAEDLTIARRIMDGVTLEFRQLSGGAQEQLGLACRLATAMLLGDDGGPLLLDDTLGHSDPERLRGLGAMIGAAAGQAQVVIFTCQPDRFAHVGGATTVRF